MIIEDVVESITRGRSVSEAVDRLIGLEEASPESTARKEAIMKSMANAARFKEKYGGLSKDQLLAKANAATKAQRKKPYGSDWYKR